MKGHTKVPGFVTRIEGDKWWARLLVGNSEYEAEMALPLPPDAKEGSYFTVHQPRRGQPYLYWVHQRITKRQVKRARQEARKMWELFS